jgi:hypothetical protein
VLSTQEAEAYAPGAGELLAANFWHHDRWHVARIPPAPVADVIVHVERVAHSFPGAHSQIRFRLSPGREVTLQPQSPDSEPDPTAIGDLLYTVEGNFPPGTSSNPRGGFQQSGIAYMLMSLRDKAEIMRVEGVLPRVHQYRLEIDDSAKQAVLLRALDIATRAESHKMFNLLRRNCTTEAIRVIDGVVHYPAWRRLLAAVTYDGLPEAMHLYLGERGLLGPESRMPDLAEDPSWQ